MSILFRLNVLVQDTYDTDKLSNLLKPHLGHCQVELYLLPVFSETLDLSADTDDFRPT